MQIFFPLFELDLHQLDLVVVALCEPSPRILCRGRTPFIPPLTMSSLLGTICAQLFVFL